MDFGRALNYWNDETHVAEAAARYAAVDTLPTAGPCANKPTLAELIKCEVGGDSSQLEHGSGSNTGSEGKGVRVNVSIPSDEVGQPVTVKVCSTYAWVPVLNLAQTELAGSATMRLERAIPQQELAKFTATESC